MQDLRRDARDDPRRRQRRGAVALARVKGPFGLRAEGLAALFGLVALCALVLAGMTAPSRAAGVESLSESTPGPWTVVDLGIARLEEHCTEAARLSFAEVAQVHGADLMRRTAWTVELIGVNYGAHDAAISCTYAATTKTRALLMIHSKSNGVQAMTIARAIDAAFARHVKRITKAWLATLDG